MEQTASRRTSRRWAPSGPPCRPPRCRGRGRYPAVVRTVAPARPGQSHAPAQCAIHRTHRHARSRASVGCATAAIDWYSAV